MHFWIDKRSSQLHQYGGGRRGPAGAGGFYSQNFGTHRSNHHPPPPSLCHHHPHRIRTRSASTANTATTSAASSSGSSNAANNNSIHTFSIPPNNNNLHGSSSASGAANGNSTSSTATIALQYPHQQPHQVQGQHALMGGPPMVGTSNGAMATGSGLRLARASGENSRSNTATTFFSHPPQQQPILGGGILAISGSSSSAVNAAAALNPPMAIVSRDDGDNMSATTVLTFPPPATSVAVNPSNSINVQLISCVNINPDSRGGIDISWRNPYHVPGSSISRCRAYSRDTVPSSLGGSSSAASSRGTRGRRTSSSSSSGLGRSSIGTVHGTTAQSLSNHSQNIMNETPDALTDRSTRSERTSFDRDTITPQRSLSLTSPEAAEQSSTGTSTGGRPSLENDPGWACTKRVGLTLCFLAFILLGTVGAKFMIQGPGVIDTSRAGKAETAAYFLFTELIFVAFAMALFFTGVACLRKRTNDYLLRQFNQYILSSSSTTAVPGTGGVISNIPPGQENYDFDYYDGSHHPSGGSRNGSPSRVHHHHLHHNLHHGGFHHFRHHRSLEEGEFGSGDLTQASFHGAGPIHYPAHYGGGNSGSRHGRSKPPPYHIALYLPLPEGMGGGSGSPVEDIHQHDGKLNKTSGASDGISLIDTSNKDAQDTAGGNQFNSSNTENHDNDGRDPNIRNEANEGIYNQSNRSETPPPPYEQL